ncbi:MAG: DUF1501 domain-containing protein [Gammaproteobacteria bacterium]
MSFTRRDIISLRAVNPDRDVLVCIFQRGAADGLNSVVPYADPDYAPSRPRIALPPAGDPGGVIDLDGFYGLHPSLAPLKPLYDAGRLALVHATGVPHQSRSHFDAQALVEGAVVSKVDLAEGWIGRHLATSLALTNSSFRAVSISGNVPFSLTGAIEPIAIEGIEEFGLGELTGSSYQALLSDWYAEQVPYSGTAQAAIHAMDELLLADPSQFTPENGAVYPETELGRKLLQAGQLIKSPLGTEVICLDVGGWDHHENLPTFLAPALSDLAASLAAFDTDMGARMGNITVLVHTEFGRRVADNSASGTDHGTASVAYLLGGGVNGGQVAGAWPGLAVDDLEFGEDLRIETDLRTVFSELLLKRLGRSETGLVFPGFNGPADLSLFL